VPTVDQAFLWLTSLPPGALYAAAFALAIIESLFPPFPSDVFIGICAFIAVQGDASPVGVYALVVAGNVAGASITYGIGRKYGAARLKARLAAKGDLDEEMKFERLYAKYGLLGLFLGRWIPGIRGLVPMLAGAMKIDPVRTLGIVTIVAMMFYGILLSFAFKVGTDWEEFYAKIQTMGKWGTIISVGLVAVGAIMALVIWRKRRRTNSEPR
jgi:membrane protein DedA with SNARE-associated domain